MPTQWIDSKIFKGLEPGKDCFPLSVSMLSWAYNEEENIVDFLAKSQELMNSLGVDFEHILIDDCSKDRTYELAKEAQKNYPQLKIIRNSKNMNVGWNIRIAIAQASKQVLFWQTVDWCYDIGDLKNSLWLLKNYDIVHGVRIRPRKPFYSKYFSSFSFLRNIRVSKRSDNLWKAIVSVTNYLVIRTLFRVKLLDFQNVTLYPSSLAKSVTFESSCSFTSPELLLKSYWKGASFKQVPVDFIPRAKGDAKGTRIKSLFTSVGQIFFCWFKWIILRQRQDFKKGVIFSPDGAVLQPSHRKNQSTSHYNQSLL